MTTSMRKMPGPWQGVLWAFSRGGEGGGISRSRLVARAIRAAITQSASLNRWMAIVFEQRGRGHVTDLPGEYLRAIRPYVHRGVGIGTRVVQLIDHIDWLESAMHTWALEQLSRDEPLVLAELTPPRGCDFMRLQLQRAPVQAPEGELVLTLVVQRSPDAQHRPPPVEIAALGFSRFRVEGKGCMAIGGVRGQRETTHRVSQSEVSQALQGWKPAVLMVRVAQELARFWGLHLVALNPAWHRLNGMGYRFNQAQRESADKLTANYDALWQHFGGHPGPKGWMVLPVNSDDQLEATALSAEKRERQTRRADFWIRTRKILLAELQALLKRPDRDAALQAAAEGPGTIMEEEDADSDYFDEDYWNSDRDFGRGRVLETGPGTIM